MTEPGVIDGGTLQDAVDNTSVEVNGEHPAAASRQVSAGITIAKKQSGIFGTSSNLVNSIVGAGIIGIPYALKNAGLVAGVFLLVLVAWLTDKSLRMIVGMASFHPKLKGKVFTYEDLASYAFGKAGSAFILLNMFILAYGAMVAYLLIIKDTVPVVFGMTRGGDDNFWVREGIMVITSIVIIVPLSLQRDMASLAFTSLISVTADIILVGFIAGYAPISETVSDAGGFKEVLKDDWINGTLFIGLGILSTAMACQHCAFIVSGSLFNQTQKRWATVSHFSITTSAILCIVLGVCGYLGFLNDTQGDILNNFATDSVAANGARGLLAITMFFTYPMECFVARHVLLKLVFDGNMDDIIQDGGDDFSGVLGFFRQRRVKWTLFIYLSTLIPALIVDDIGPVLSFTGAIGGSCVSFIAPGLIYLGINGQEFLEWTSGLLSNYQRKNGTSSAGDIELPVAGDSNAVIQDQAESTTNSANGGGALSAYHGGPSKPWWWFLCGFPLWCAIASTGSVTMRETLEQYDRDFGATPQYPNNGGGESAEGTLAEETNKDVFIPIKRDYIASFFFVAFGVVAMVAGVVYNIYVQVNDVIVYQN